MKPLGAGVPAVLRNSDSDSSSQRSFNIVAPAVRRAKGMQPRCEERAAIVVRYFKRVSSLFQSWSSGRSERLGWPGLVEHVINNPWPSPLGERISHCSGKEEDRTTSCVPGTCILWCSGYEVSCRSWGLHLRLRPTKRMPLPRSLQTDTDHEAGAHGCCSVTSAPSKGACSVILASLARVRKSLPRFQIHVTSVPRAQSMASEASEVSFPREPERSLERRRTASPRKTSEVSSSASRRSSRG